MMVVVLHLITRKKTLLTGGLLRTSCHKKQQTCTNVLVMKEGGNERKKLCNTGKACLKWSTITQLNSQYLHKFSVVSPLNTQLTLPPQCLGCGVHGIIANRNLDTPRTSDNIALKYTYYSSPTKCTTQEFSRLKLAMQPLLIATKTHLAFL